ncbi:MAG: response regulator [Anaerolineae bacterium]|nr:response regulator [Anaerolineae bacterium]
MPPEVQARAFEPFFTTKRDHGTGLGLAIVQRITRDHQGHIWLETFPDQGSAFYVALPLTDELTAASPPQDQQEDVASGDEIILVVEDDEVVRSLTERLLHRQGYRTVIASSPKEALAILETLPQPPVLLFSDVVMPEMNGLELAQIIKKRIPSLKVLLTSGYPNETMAARGIEDNGYKILPKPYTAATLTQAIREVLDGG